MPAPVQVTIFSKPGCHLCENVEKSVRKVQGRMKRPFEISIVNILSDPALEAEYGFDIPVVAIDGNTYSQHYLNADAFEHTIKEVSIHHAYTT